MNKKTTMMIGVIVLILAAIFGYLQFDKRNASKYSGPIQNVNVRFKWFHNAQFAGFYVAQEKGIYDDYGLNVSFLELNRENYKPFDELNDGSVQFSVVNSTDQILNRVEGSQTTAVMAVHQTSPTAYMSLIEAGIKVPTDLKDKRFGNPGGREVGKAMISALLNKTGVNQDEVSIVDLGFDQLADLKSGNADILTVHRTSAPIDADREGLGYDLLFPELYGFERYGDILVTTDELIVSDPDLVKRFVSATREGWDWALAHPKESAELVAKYNPEADIEREKLVLESSIPLIHRSDQALGAMRLDIWQSEVDILLNNKLLQNQIDASTLFTNSFIE